ncbi:transporter substrate-binding domain-containing protein [Haematospirillum sp. H1815]|uniref:substrate-binding periplasmic protein n=1 Tax=Haematospirillum sp. H1815 TaxID=2723108 RepID=UPI00143910CC|nr:transporter substrate-binding domain-containing protein [Haematospirillum sp. H1815]NKD76785.1 transporter substrate-binding domain-containing protein [Haematospirillum sp. H1815]
MRIRPVLAVLACAMLPEQASSATPILTLNTEEWYPFSYTKEHKSSGTAVEIVRLIMKQAGISYQIVNGPWNRSYNTALVKPENCVFPTQITKDRKPLFKWVSPIETNRWVVYRKKGSPLQAKTLDDLKGKIIGGYIGDAIAVHLKGRGFSVEEATADHFNVKKLESGKIDAWATTQISGMKLAKDGGLEIEQVLEIRENTLALACNRTLDDALVSKLQAALDALEASGEAEKIRQSKFLD